MTTFAGHSTSLEIKLPNNNSIFPIYRKFPVSELFLDHKFYKRIVKSQTITLQNSNSDLQL